MTGFLTQGTVDWFLFTDPWMVETKWYSVGKYTSPMDPMGCFCLFVGAESNYE